MANASFWDYLKSRTAWIQLALILGSIVLLLLVTWFGLNLYTRQGQQIKVPNIKDLQIAQAQVALRRAGLNYEVIDSVFIPGRQGSQVVEQDPPPGSPVKEGRKIYLTISSGRVPTVILTDLRDLTLRQAQLELEKQRLVLGIVSQDPSVVSALVIRASLNGRELKAGTRIAQGSVVDLVTGIVQSDSAGYIPDLAGLALDDAFESLNNAGLNLGKVEYSGAISDTTSALIFKQRPEFIPNQPIQSGAYIDVWLRQSE